MTFESDYTTGGRETVRDLLVDAERRLTNVGVPSPNVDAAEIIAFALGTTRGRMILQDPVSAEQRVAVEQMLTKRLTRVPLQHLVGSTGFRHLDIAVGPGVFIPRPETELVAEAAIRELAEQPVPSRIAVDLCAGSGAIAIALGTEVDHSRVYAVELSDDAIGWTRRNVTAYDDQLTSLGSRGIMPTGMYGGFVTTTLTWPAKRASGPSGSAAVVASCWNTSTRDPREVSCSS